MKIRTLLHASFLLFTIVLFSFNTLSCKRKTGTNVSTLTAVNPYIYGYTSGVISKASPVKIQFADNVAAPETIGKTASKDIVSISPNVAGTFTWEDERTLRFDPVDPLPTATSFTVAVNVNKVIKAAKGDDASFTFQFRTRDQYYQTNLDGLYYPNESNYNQVQVKGVVFTADVADPASVEGMLKASQGGSPVKIRWDHSADQMAHYYILDGLQRGNSSTQVRLQWDGKSLGSKETKQETFNIPPAGQFTLLDAKPVQGQEQYILCQFSDPLKPDQLLDGLLSLSGYTGGTRYIIESNRVRVYPATPLNGSFRLQARDGIRNTRNQRMSSEGAFDVVFEDVQPQVRLTGRGVIMPNSNGLMFPFEAVGLQAVDVEVFKIFHNNIPQFLQDNNLEGDYDLYKVGRIVLQRKVELQTLNPSANTTSWGRYALDLGTLIRQDEQAIYSIRIGFRPEYASVRCQNTNIKQEDSQPFAYTEGVDEMPEDMRSIMDFWYGPYGWADDYEWNRRSDPCYSEYYNSDRFVQRNILASNLGLIAKAGGDKEVFAVVTDLRSTDPVSNAQLEVYDFQLQLIGQGATGKDGMARIAIKGKPFILIAKQNKERGYLRLQDGESLSMSRYDISGAVTQKGLKGMIYGERGVWRPGDSIFLNFILEDKAQRLPDGYPIAMEVYNARGQLQEKRTTGSNMGGIYPLHFKTAVDAPTGNWRVKVKAGGATFERVLKVETVKPNRLEIALDFGREKIQGTREAIAGTLKATWLHGATASGLKAIVEGQLARSATGFNKFPSFVFTDPARKLEDTEAQVVFEGPLDGAGEAKIRANLLGNQSAPGMLNAIFRTRVFEPGGDFSTDYLAVPYSPYPAYTGIEIPLNKYGEPRVDVKQSSPIRFAAVTPEGAPIAGKTLTVGVYTVEWRWWWDQYYEDVSSYNTSTHYNAESRYSVKTNAQGIATLQFKPEKWGRYLIRVCDDASGHCSGSFFYAGNPWYGSDDDQQYRDIVSMLSFKPDKEKYQVGETASLTIPGGAAGRILVSLENGSKVLQAFWVQSKAGENTVSFKVTPEMSPTVYANISLIQPHAQANNDLPIRLYGVAPIQVEDPGSVLSPEIKMPASLKPEQTAAIEVKEKSGKAMAYTLAMVDEGLLGLTRFKTPNPRDIFYAREALGVLSWDMYSQVLGAFSGNLERILSIGGDEAVDPSALNNTANRFEPVVRFLGPFELKKGATNKHQIAMPNYVGAVRVMVVAASKGAYGAAEQRVPVRNPLMVLATAPRMLSPGESFQLPVNVFANDTKIKSVQVTLSEKSGLASIEGGATKTVTFSATGSQIVNFPIKIKSGVGIARFSISAQGAGENAKQEIEIQVRNPNPYTTTVYSEVIEPGKSWKQAYTPVGMAGTQSAVLEVSTVPPLNLGERLEYLLQYPYGCIEQTISAAFPQLFAAQLMDMTPADQKKTADNIKAAIDRLKQFQTAEGGFGYWPGSTSPDHWSSSYAGHFMLEAKAKGYEVPANLITDWAKFQKKVARMWDPKMTAFGFGSESSHQLNQAYRLYTLALAGQADMPSMNRLREYADLKSSAQWRLAAAYALAGKADVAKQLAQDQSTEVEEYNEFSFTYGSSVRDRALILETLILLKDSKRAATLASYLSGQLNSSSWMSTQTTAQTLLAMAKYVGDNKPADGMAFNFQTGNGKSTNAGSKSPVMQISLDQGGKAQAGPVTLNNTGKNKLFVRLILRGQAMPGEAPATANDLNISVAFKTSDGKALNPENIPQGADFIAEVKVTHPGSRPIPYQELALSQVFPSGWEILNTRMGEMTGSTQSQFDYQDFRDDRVNTFFGLTEGQSKVYRVQINAAYQGRFFLPPSSCAAMYDNSVSASTKGQWVNVGAQRGI